MDIQRKCFEESNNVNPDWSFKFDEELQQYIALDSEMELQVDEFNEHWDTFRAAWQAAKAIPNAFVVVPKEPTQEMIDKFPEVFYQDTYAGECSMLVDDETIRNGYKAMIEAAQEPAND